MIDVSHYPAIHKEIYFSENFSDVAKELKRRSENKELDAMLSDYWDLHRIPDIDFFKNGPYAVLSRSSASPNAEQKHFLEFARKNGLTPVILEYDGKFVTRNLEKLYLCKMHFYSDKNSKEYDHPVKICVADTNVNQGKSMSQILTHENKPLLDFHHDLFFKHADTTNCNICNFTEWFNMARVIGPNYYFFFLLIFMKNAVLFDNYTLSDSEESRFVEEKILPSIHELQEKFGLRPLIFPLVPIKTETDMHWLSYSGQIQEEIENTFKKQC
ncbi:MAG: hypothetical protein EXS52_00840 [Candidatus Staskawiczbacteria bacterium]|nr:hypothetical protein [Candidatus Staskawiczbacteria bacterium]